MKKLFLLLICATLFTSCANDDLYKKYLGLKGKVEKVVESKYGATEKFGEPIKGDLLQVEAFTFTDAGKVSLQELFDYKGDLINSTATKFIGDDWNEVVSKNSYSDFKEIRTTVTERSKNQIKSKAVDDNGNTLSESIETINFEKRTTVSEITDVDNNKDRFEVWLDSNNNCLEVKFTKKGLVVYWMKASYDSNNNEVERKELHEQGTHYTYTYPKLDKKGNWIEKQELVDGKIKNIYTREITYK